MIDGRWQVRKESELKKKNKNKMDIKRESTEEREKSRACHRGQSDCSDLFSSSKHGISHHTTHKHPRFPSASGLDEKPPPKKRWAPVITSTDSFLIILSNISAGGWRSFLQALVDAVITSKLPNRASTARRTTGLDRQLCQKVTEMWKCSINWNSPNLQTWNSAELVWADFH